jgi:twinkle protein
MTPKEINSRLITEVENICQEIFPNGKRNGNNWEIGSIHGEVGQSLKICLSGNRAGIWKEFNSDDKGGDLIDLYAKAKGVNLSEAIRWAKDRLGIVDHKIENKRTYIKPAKPECSKPKSKVLEWLIEIRHITMDAINAYKIAEQDDNVIFPSLRAGELIRWKSRNIHDKHKCQTSKDSEPCLFGWQAIPDVARSVVICEGEIDAMTWWQLGFPALSVPNGANGLTWIEVEYDYLERFDVINLSMDMDDAGQKVIPQIIDRLGRERVRVVSLPKPWKDINDILKTGVIVPADKYIAEAKTLDPEELKHAAFYAEKVFDIFTGKSTEAAGYYTPWKKVRERFRFRPGELTILAGENFHGKSQGAGHFCVDFMQQGARVCVASLEFKPEKWIARIVRQACAMHPNQVTENYLNETIGWTFDKLWAFDATGTAKADHILSVFQYAQRRYGIKIFIIDNLAKCGFDEDDYNGQKHFIDALTDFAKKTDCHIILVHHLNKSNDESGPRNKSAVKGTGAITDMADNVIIWWRNRTKEKAIEDLKIQGEEIPEDLLNKPDAIMIVEKDRDADGTPPKVMLWFDPLSHQFLGGPSDRAKIYIRSATNRLLDEDQNTVA